MNMQVSLGINSLGIFLLSLLQEQEDFHLPKALVYDIIHLNNIFVYILKNVIK